MIAGTAIVSRTIGRGARNAARAIAGAVSGARAALWGWANLGALSPDIAVETGPPRPYPNPDR